MATLPMMLERNPENVLFEMLHGHIVRYALDQASEDTSASSAHVKLEAMGFSIGSRLADLLLATRASDPDLELLYAWHKAPTWRKEMEPSQTKQFIQTGLVFLLRTIGSELFGEQPNENEKNFRLVFQPGQKSKDSRESFQIIVFCFKFFTRSCGDPATAEKLRKSTSKNSGDTPLQQCPKLLGQLQITAGIIRGVLTAICGGASHPIRVVPRVTQPPECIFNIHSLTDEEYAALGLL